jgi:hypothetical protein
MQHIAVDEDHLAGVKQILGLSTEHERISFNRENDLHFLVPVPWNVTHEVFSRVFIIARAGKNRRAVLGELVQIGCDGNIEQLKSFHDAVFLVI